MARDKRKPLIEIDQNGKFLKFWESGRDAGAHYGFTPVYISQYLKGRVKSAKKHYFRIATESEINMYRSVQQRIKDKKIEIDPPQIAEGETFPTIPPEIIPEKVNRDSDGDDHLSPFDLMIKKCKEKFK